MRPESDGGVAHLKLRWLGVKNDWSEWDFDLDGQRGTIRAKWKDDPTHWELRTYDGSIISMRTVWPNDPTEWRITDNSTTLIWKSRWKNQLDEWLADDPNHGRFYVYSLRENDPRDWAIDDRLGDEISRPMRLAMVFVAIFQASPRI